MASRKPNQSRATKTTNNSSKAVPNQVTLDEVNASAEELSKQIEATQTLLDKAIAEGNDEATKMQQNILNELESKKKELRKNIMEVANMENTKTSEATTEEVREALASAVEENVIDAEVVDGKAVESETAKKKEKKQKVEEMVEAGEKKGLTEMYDEAKSMNEFYEHAHIDVDLGEAADGLLYDERFSRKDMKTTLGNVFGVTKENRKKLMKFFDELDELKDTKENREKFQDVMKEIKTIVKTLDELTDIDFEAFTNDDGTIKESELSRIFDGVAPIIFTIVSGLIYQIYSVAKENGVDVVEVKDAMNELISKIPDAFIKIIPVMFGIEDKDEETFDAEALKIWKDVQEKVGAVITKSFKNAFENMEVEKISPDDISVEPTSASDKASDPVKAEVVVVKEKAETVKAVEQPKKKRFIHEYKEGETVPKDVEMESKDFYLKNYGIAGWMRFTRLKAVANMGMPVKM